MAILNSRIAQFYFKKKFNSIKILRSHIEQIPIPKVDTDVQNEIISIVDCLIKENDHNKILGLYNKVDKKIADIYHITALDLSLIEKSSNNENLFLF